MFELFVIVAVLGLLFNKPIRNFMHRFKYNYGKSVRREAFMQAGGSADEYEILELMITMRSAMVLAGKGTKDGEKMVGQNMSLNGGKKYDNEGDMLRGLYEYLTYEADDQISEEVRMWRFTGRTLGHRPSINEQKAGLMLGIANYQNERQLT